MPKIAKPLVFGAVLLLAPACHTHYSQVNGGASLSILPLKSLRLYETGVGYFERSGSIGANNSGLPVPAGHLDDALKTLVLLSPDGAARVSGIEFPTSVSKGMGRALAGLPQSGDDAVTYRDLLVALKGANIEVHTRRGPVSGRLIDVLGTSDGAITAPPVEVDAEKDKDKKGKKEAADPQPAPGSSELTLLLLSTQGELVRLSTAAISSLRPLDPHFAGRLRTALDAVTQRGAQSQRLLRLLSRDGGPVTLGYVSETPLWRVTYRLVLNEPQKAAALQGWALIHNDTDEEWHGVRVHLVSGRPDSYLFPLAAPRYSRRQLVTPESEASTVPQLLGTTPDKMWGDHIEEGGSGGLGLSGHGSGGGGTGEGTIGLGNIGTIGHGSGRAVFSDRESSLLQVGNLASVAQATGVESGALFTYSLSEPLELRAHGSALIPFVSEGIEAEVISWMESPSASARSGVRLVNSTHQTLPSGPLAIFNDGGLAGESSLDRMKPGERRFIQYGHDLDVELTAVRSQSKNETQRLTFDRDRLEEHFLRKQDVIYRVVNRSGQARTLYLGLGLGANARVQGADRLDFDTETKHAVAIFELPPQSRVERPISTVEGVQHTTELKGLRSAALIESAGSAAVPPAEKAIVLEAAARQKELEEAGKENEHTQVEIKKTEKEISRLREHLKAMGHETAAGAAQNPVLKRILDAEDRLTGLQKKLDQLESAQDQRRDAVRKVLEKLPKKA